MSRSTGTVKSVDMWLRSQRIDKEQSGFALLACEMDGNETVSSWDCEQVTSDPGKWCEEVVGLVDGDSEGRGKTTRYQLVHTRGGNAKGTCVLRRVIQQEPEDRDRFDGTNSGLVTKLLSSLDRAHGQLLDANRVATEAQGKAMQLLGQSYTLLANAQAQQAVLHGRVLEGEAAAIINGGGKGKPKKDDPVTMMMETMGPELVAGLLEKVLPKLLPDMFGDDDEPTTSSVVAQAAE